jgi:hypothetical protein
VPHDRLEALFAQHIELASAQLEFGTEHRA